MLGHIYIGTIGMEGAFEAMGEGTVDLNWAKEHHSLWLEEEKARTGPNRVAAPADGDAGRIGRDCAPIAERPASRPGVLL